MEELDKSTFSHPVASLPGVTGTSRRWWESMESSRPPASPLRLSASSTIQKRLSPPTTCTVLPGSACTLSAPLSTRSGAAPTSMDRWIENGWMDGWLLLCFPRNLFFFTKLIKSLNPPAELQRWHQQQAATRHQRQPGHQSERHGHRHLRPHQGPPGTRWERWPPSRVDWSCV